MSVLHIIVGLGIGGAELMLRRLAVAQRPTTVVSLTDLGPVGRMLQADGVEVVSLGLRGIWDLPRVFLATLRLLRERQPSVVQTWMVHADLIGGLAARLSGIRAVIWGVRQTEFDDASRATRLIRWCCARLSARVPAVIVCAAEASRRSHAAVGYDATRMVVIPNGFDIDRFKPDTDIREQTRTGLGIGKDEFVIGHIGRWNPNKDHPNFVKAVAQAFHQWPVDRPVRLRIVMAGRGVEATNPVLAAALASTGHSDRFLLLGERADVPDLLRSFDLFCLSSRTEGFPNVVGEAMASGVPCVVTNVGDAALIVGQTGWVVPREDAAALAEALLAAAQQATATLGLRALNARQRICDEFSMQLAFQRFSEIQARVAESHGQTQTTRK